MTSEATIDFQSERLNRGLSRQAFAEEIGVSEETVRRVEGGYVPTPRIAKKFADYFGKRVTDLWPAGGTPRKAVA